MKASRAEARQADAVETIATKTEAIQAELVTMGKRLATIETQTRPVPVEELQPGTLVESEELATAAELAALKEQVTALDNKFDELLAMLTAPKTIKPSSRA